MLISVFGRVPRKKYRPRVAAGHRCVIQAGPEVTRHQKSQLGARAALYNLVPPSCYSKTSRY